MIAEQTPASCPADGMVMPLPRLMAMAKQCRRHGGECPCGTDCKAEMGLLRVKNRLQRELSNVDHKLKWLQRTPATVKAGWAKPEKPDGDYFLAVHFDSDEAILHWSSDTESVDFVEIVGEAAWPFNEETAWPDDFERLGVVVV